MLPQSAGGNAAASAGGAVSSASSAAVAGAAPAVSANKSSAEKGKPTAGVKRARALYSFAAIKPTHLNAQCWEEFVVVNDKFDWCVHACV